MSDHLARQTKNRLARRQRAAKKLEFLRWLILVPFEGRQRRKAVAELERLDDRMLADIGILRSEIPQVIDGIGSQKVELAFPKPSNGTPQYARNPTRAAA
ncbi:DUF1127 domain-containing protein [Mesorhizobium sp. INR15]|uniref:DUF1127 domain-containing protein n=1 Tax=Mesorhizobium sp. INR15 TaxID=2654248 RepID=UPI0018964AF1|nr:DUF1127 domain-containing protein [Mesorhizobium sp. INR15]QPC92974.1 DUF1127 domain-containing protein [Mesorhizobium sp. INR15]